MIYTQDGEKQNKNTTQYVLDTTMRKQTQITKIRHESFYKQLDVILSSEYLVLVDIYFLLLISGLQWILLSLGVYEL